ncbi:MAG: YhbY family RNA-binding protein [Oscillospiraceae bacterium]|nr:YhbY family RNA-binding protein [Oscillospiraceae bacterium]
MNSKERARLRGLASTQETIIQVGKGGITPNVIASVDTALSARELIKGKVLESSMLTAREACEQLAEACHAEPVQTIGTKFVLYRKNEEK